MQGKNNLDWLRNLFLLLILIVLVAGDWAGNLFIRFIIIPAVISFLAGSLVQAVSGDRLKKILIIIKIGSVRISISAFLIAVLILRFVGYN